MSISVGREVNQTSFQWNMKVQYGPWTGGCSPRLITDVQRDTALENSPRLVFYAALRCGLAVLSWSFTMGKQSPPSGQHVGVISDHIPHQTARRRPPPPPPWFPYSPLEGKSLWLMSRLRNIRGGHFKTQGIRAYIELAELMKRRNIHPHQGYFYQISKGGNLRFWTFSRTQILTFFNKRCKIVDLSLWCVIQRSRNFTKHSKLWTFFYAAWLRGSALKKIQNFGPFSKGRGLFNKTSKIVDLFGKPLGQRSRYFTKDPKLWTFLSGAWLRGP